MALKHLVEPECGGSNPLMQWSSNLIQGQPRAAGVFNRDRLSDLQHHGGNVEDNEMVREFLQEESSRPMVPQTFNMASLLQEIPQVPQPTHDTKQNAVIGSWVKEFGQEHSNMTPRQQTIETRAEQEWVEEFNDSNLQKEEPSVKQWLEEFSTDPNTLEAEKWVQEFQSQDHGDDDGVAKVAREMASSVTDPKIQESEFMKFINKLGNGEVRLDSANEEDWDKQFLEQTEHSEEFWSNLEDAWSSAMKTDPSMHPWLKDFEHQQEYKFAEDNPMKSVENPFKKGLEKLRNGDLPAAVLYFEAHVQEHPDSVEGWQYLGTSQAHNEQDTAAVTALEKCLQLDPGNLPALQGLAVSYTNESLQSKACQTLRNWLKMNPKYSSIVPEAPQAPAKPIMASFMSKEEHKEVTDLYLQAARISANEVDPDVQIGLGVLFNLSCEYDKAVDCFTAALQVRPDDPMLWNKLGATQANSNKSEEAIHAYRRALELAPGLTRSRYNLGISCINLRAYKEAAEHFLMALNLQRSADSPQGTQSLMSEGIWSTLRLALIYEEKPQLLPLVDSRNLDGLLKEFGL